MAYPQLSPWPLQSVTWFRRLLNGKRQRRRGRFPVRFQLEALETRIVPTIYTLPLVNLTGLNPAQETIYVLGFSTASQMELQSNGQFAQIPAGSGVIPSYDIRTLPSITLDSTTTLIGARLYFFVAPHGMPAPMLAYANDGRAIVQPANPPNNIYPFDIVEITQPPGGRWPSDHRRSDGGWLHLPAHADAEQ